MSGKKFVATFICLWIIWIFLTGAIKGFVGLVSNAGSFSGLVNVVSSASWSGFVTLLHNSMAMQEVVAGGIIAIIVSSFSYEYFTTSPGSIFNPIRWAYLIAYIPAYIWVEIKSHLNVAYRILNPSMPIDPSIVELPSEFESDDDVGLTTLANSITMTPGTLTVDIDEGKPRLFVHWITAGDRIKPEQAYDGIGKQFERFLKGGLG